MTTITIDCGASFIKGAAFKDGVMGPGLSRRSPSAHDDSSPYKIQQILPLVNAVKRMIIDLAGKEREICLCISNEMHGFILSFEDGKPYTDYISWQKELGRIQIDGKSSCELLSENAFLKKHIRDSGMPLRAGLPSSNLFYLYRTGGLSKACGKLYFYTLGSYLLKMLSGGAEPMENPTNAAATGLYNLTTGSWDREYINAIGAQDILFPVIGNDFLNFELEGIKVYALPAIGDQQAALLGAGFERKDDLSFNLGTGAQVSVLVDAPEFGDGYQIRPFFFGKYLKTVPHIPSGRALNVYFRFVKSVLERYGLVLEDDTIWKGIQDAAEAADAEGLLVDLSFFENAISSKTTGCIVQIKEHGFSMESLMRAVLEQMSDNFIMMAERIIPESSDVRRLVFSGGIARRFAFIRSRIAAYFPNSEVSLSKDETMWGLYRYGIQR